MNVSIWYKDSVYYTSVRELRFKYFTEGKLMVS